MLAARLLEKLEEAAAALGAALEADAPGACRAARDAAWAARELELECARIEAYEEAERAAAGTEERRMA